MITGVLPTQLKNSVTPFQKLVRSPARPRLTPSSTVNGQVCSATFVTSRPSPIIRTSSTATGNRMRLKNWATAADMRFAVPDAAQP